jgi:serine protease Do
MDEFNNINNERKEETNEQRMNEVNQGDTEASITDEPVSFVEEAKPEKTIVKKQSVLSLWLSGLVGGLTVAVIGFLLLFNGVIPFQNEAIPTDDTSESTSSLIQITTSEDEVSTDMLSNVSESVVGVANIQGQSLWSESSDAGSGSGVVYKIEDDRAYVVTNHHVIDGADSIEVILTDGERVEAQLHGSDELTDLAVLSIDKEHVSTVATFGSSDDLVVGETAIAIGNPLGEEFAGTVTKGIISGVNRSLTVDSNQDGRADWTVEVIQTDAAINPGNSGGALINSQGEVIGINSMKIALESVEGIGFAIPIDEARPIIEQLETEGEVNRPFMGISAVDFSTVPTEHVIRTLNLDPNEVTSGIVVAEVHPGSSAAEAGLETYDVITDIDGTAITNMMDLRQYLYQETSIGDTITVTFYRDGIQSTVDVTLQGE